MAFDVICDIDGTVAQIDHRLYHLDKTPKDWAAFYGDIENDIPIAPVIDVIHTLWASRCNIIFCTGRTDDHREKTAEWLRKHVVPPVNLYMRKSKDFRDDGVVKLELLEQIQKDGFNPRIVFDDRDRVVAMWRSQGLICAQVNKGDF